MASRLFPCRIAMLRVYFRALERTRLPMALVDDADFSTSIESVLLRYSCLQGNLRRRDLVARSGSLSLDPDPDPSGTITHF